MNNKITPEKKSDKSFKTIFLIAGGIAILGGLLVATAAIQPKRPEVKPTDPSETPAGIDTTALEVESLQKQTQTLTANLKKLYENQQNLQSSLTACIQNLQNLQKESRENREYIAKLYQRILDIELQLQTVGGGFNMKREKPTIPQDEFPQSP
jgi:hypothetical protein